MKSGNQNEGTDEVSLRGYKRHEHDSMAVSMSIFSID